MKDNLDQLNNSKRRRRFEALDKADDDLEKNQKLLTS
jgi:hypothetical protein